MQSLLRAGIIGGIEQPSWITQPITEPVQLPTSPRYFVHMILCLLVLLILCEITWSELVNVVILCEILETYVCECWRLMFVCELV
jgi:hypothetical protein